QVDDIEVWVLPELGHVDPKDPDVVCSHQFSSRGSNPKPMASVPSSSLPTAKTASLTFIPSVTCSGSGGVLITLPRTLVPSQSTTPATNGTGTPGAAKATIVKVLSSPSAAR